MQSAMFNAFQMIINVFHNLVVIKLVTIVFHVPSTYTLMKLFFVLDFNRFFFLLKSASSTFNAYYDQLLQKLYNKLYRN